ncbi:MAG TPA: hypothetical protein VJ724_09000 [Tahibacter sp.]|nr:hypothetical protein [Tahibacter sp.]
MRNGTNRSRRLLASAILACIAVQARATDADLRLEIDDLRNYFAPGYTAHYQASVRNQGATGITGLKIRGSTSPGLSCTWACDSTRGIACENAGSGNIDHVVDLPANRTVYYDLWCTVAADATGTIDQTMTVELPPGFVNIAPAGNSVVDRNDVHPPTDLRITAVDNVGMPVAPGHIASHRIQATNVGPSPITDAWIFAQFPTICAWTCSAQDAGATCPPSFGSPAASLGEAPDLAAGSSVVYNVSCPVPAGYDRNLVTTVSIGGAYNDPDLNDNVAEVQTPISTATSTDLVVTIDDVVGKVRYGETVSYEVRARNAGASASAAQVVLTRHAYLANEQWSCEALDGATCGGMINDTPTRKQDVDLPPGATALIRYAATYVGRADSGNLGERIAQRARVVNIGTTDTNIANNGATADTRVSLFYGTFDQ